jgi:hypothetical protein
MDRRSPVGEPQGRPLLIALVSARQPSPLRDAMRLAILFPKGQEYVLFSPYPLPVRAIPCGTARYVTSIRASQEVALAVY